MYLTELTVDTSVLVEVRQLASLLLKQYVEVHWSQHSEKFRQPETTERVTSGHFLLCNYTVQTFVVCPRLTIFFSLF